MLAFPLSKSQRAIAQYSVLPIMLLTIGLGWKYPLFGVSVPIVMFAGAIVSLFRGRFLCGHFCPRGAFFDRVMPRWSQKTEIPAWMRDIRVRWGLFAALMGLTIFRLSQQPFSIASWGHIFWQLCVMTTVIGVILAVIFHPRTWCTFCPIGTLQNALGGAKQPIRIDAAACRSCRLCEKKCPLALAIVSYKDAGKIENRDCLKCAECVHACPTRALSFESC